MRMDTQNAAAYLVWQLQTADVVTNIRDDGDLLLMQMKPTRETVAIYMVERSLSVGDIHHHMQANSQRGWHTLFLLWLDMLLPPDGKTVPLQDWSAALISLYGDKIWAFEVAGQEAYYLPVHYTGGGYQRTIRYGKHIRYDSLMASSITTDSPLVRGTWRIASFEGRPASAAPRIPAELQAHYALLGLEVGADMAALKQRFRAMARQYHPDVNPSPAAAQKMRQLNEAYQRIIAHLNRKP